MDIPTGLISLWSGSIASIPAGWALCDGSSGTPDLEDQFVRGAGDTFDPGDTGGSVAHSHGFTSNPHSHTHAGGTGIMAGGGFLADTSPVTVVGNTNPASTLPLFFALAYIMKL